MRISASIRATAARPTRRTDFLYGAHAVDPNGDLFLRQVGSVGNWTGRIDTGYDMSQYFRRRSASCSRA